MKIHVLVEGPSEVAFFDRWLPRAFAGHQFVTHKHQGKGSLPKDPDKPPARHLRGLLDLLPATLRGYADALATNDEAVIVVVDADAVAVVQGLARRAIDARCRGGRAEAQAQEALEDPPLGPA